MNALFLAQVQPPPIEGVGTWVWYLLGALAAVLLVMNVALTSRRLFGRTPSVTEALASLATLKDLADAEKRSEALKHDLNLRARGLEEQISGLRHELRNECNALMLDAQERRVQFSEHIKQLSNELSAMRERTEGHIRKLDMIEQKLDRVSERMVERMHQPPEKRG